MKKKEKKTSWIGEFFSILYFFSVITFLTYFIIRMDNKRDVTFYDTFHYNEKPPSINLNQDNFYGGFALENPMTYDPFIDETIYYPRAYFKKGKRNGDKWNWEIKEFELERCKIEKFGKSFQDKFNKNVLDNLYCFKEINETLFGHFSYDEYSFFFIQLFPCINTTENKNHCKPLEVIDYYLSGTFLAMEFEDIELTPLNYSYPVRPRNQDIYFTVGKKLFQEVHIFYQIVNVETDEDIFGLEPKYQINEYLKYHSTYQMTNLIENDIYETGESFCDISIKLYDQIRIQRRTYKKLIEIMAYFEGFMDIIYFIIDLILIFHINPLYEIDIVNKLFKFDLENKLIYIKKFPKSNIPIDFLVLNNNCLNNNKKFENNNNYKNNAHAKNIKNNDNNDLNSTNITKDNKIHNDVNDFSTNDRDIY